jgi:hypothetical protein
LRVAVRLIFIPQNKVDYVIGIQFDVRRVGTSRLVGSIFYAIYATRFLQKARRIWIWEFGIAQRVGLDRQITKTDEAPFLNPATDEGRVKTDEVPKVRNLIDGIDWDAANVGGIRSIVIAVVVVKDPISMRRVIDSEGLTLLGPMHSFKFIQTLIEEIGDYIRQIANPIDAGGELACRLGALGQQG